MSLTNLAKCKVGEKHYSTFKFITTRKCLLHFYLLPNLVETRAQDNGRDFHKAKTVPLCRNNNRRQLRLYKHRTKRTHVLT